MSFKLLPRDHPSRSRLPQAAAAWHNCEGGPKVWPRIEGGHPKFAGGAGLAYRDLLGCWRKIFRKFSEFLSYGHWTPATTSAFDVLKRIPTEVNGGHFRERRMSEFATAATPNFNSVRETLRDVKLARSLSVPDLRVLRKSTSALLSDKVTATEPFTRATRLPQRRRTERTEYHGISASVP